MLATAWDAPAPDRRLPAWLPGGARHRAAPRKPAAGCENALRERWEPPPGSCLGQVHQKNPPAPDGGKQLCGRARSPRGQMRHRLIVVPAASDARLLPHGVRGWSTGSVHA
jgi:hypothetical protein